MKKSRTQYPVPSIQKLFFQTSGFRLLVYGLICFLSFLTVPACKQADDSGYVNRFSNFDEITPGLTREEVQSRLGSPSSMSTFGDETWYYIGTKGRAYAFSHPNVKEKNAWYVTFDKSGTVAKAGAIEEKNVESFSMIGDKTPTEGQDLTIMQQLLGNLGRFNPTGRQTE